jgi:peptidoglycan/LPS O-acetylase OafA/YrhL
MHFDFQNSFKSLYTRPASHLAALDGLRALSILFLLIFHAFFVYKLLEHLKTPLDTMILHLGVGWVWVVNGDKGVDIFFVLSGFLISGILFKELKKTGQINLKRFYLNRYLRLTPVYYFVLILYWLGNGPNSENIWANFLYVNNFFNYDEQAMGWSWSLAVEEQFYILYPLLILVLVNYIKSISAGLWVALGLSIVIISYVVLSDPELSSRPASHVVDQAFFMHVFSVLYDNLHTRFGSLIIGSLSAYYYFFHQQKLSHYFNSRYGFALTIIGLSTVLLLLLFPVYLRAYDEYQSLQAAYWIFNRYVFSVGIAIVLLASLVQQGLIADFIRAVLSWRVWIPIARLSYSVYLIHLMVFVVITPIIIELSKLTENQSWTTSDIVLIGFVVGSAISFLLAFFMYTLIEKPIMNLRR